MYNNETISYKEIIDKYITAYNSFDISGMLSCFHEEIKFENISGGIVTMSLSGIDELKEQAEAAANIFSSRCQTITDFRYVDSRAEVFLDFSGIFAADIPGGPKAGDKIELKGKSEFRFRDGKIIDLKDIS